ncbi:serine hydrolase domain-containing protein [Pseudoruegeria sp. SHC-113]|uniref:serine hydrolase domain-containing protein n=1 Tax=Pseudoruegeria sp. SHC-113 TaxID=2855439 RepID=UPI0021BAA838|nr:serine hydrolase [Pseudoruegeria sp. SHC-113]MCT8158693.1 beta-lactamase family protein [Pseudoruegeria sp. SHC-113]
MFKRILKITASLVGLLLLGGLAFLWIAPPDLLRVGTNYSAKIVCSNVFLAGRDADEVLAVDVQAPGHPLLKYVSIKVDSEAQAVEARLFRFFAPATSAYRAGLGCSNTQSGTLSAAQLDAPAAPGTGLWPAGNRVAPSQDPEVLAALSDPALLGEGFRAAVAVKNGRIIGESYAEGFTADTPLLGWSMTKTVTAGLIGTLIHSGQMALQDDLTASYPEWATDDRKAITVEDMLAMASGLRWNEGYGNVSDVTRMLYLVDDMAGFAASQPAEAAPQQVFTYSSGTSTMLARLWQDVVGEDSLTYPKKALFQPLGMASAVMETDARDTFVGSSYMYATARDWARFGQFLLQGGEWNGAALLPVGFTDWMFEPVPASDGVYAKGHLWLEASGDKPPFEDAVWLSGHDGQSIGIFPSHDLVVVRLGLTPSRLGYSALPLAQALIEATE